MNNRHRFYKEIKEKLVVMGQLKTIPSATLNREEQQNRVLVSKLNLLAFTHYWFIVEFAFNQLYV